MLIKVAGSTLNQIPIDWEGNKLRISEAIKQSKMQNVSVLCLPELSLTGYGCEDIFFNPHIHEKAIEVLFDLIPETKDIITGFGLPLMFQGNLFNCIAVVANQKLIGFVPKKNLAREGVHYEPRWFKAWPAKVIREIEINKISYPIGDIHFDFNGLKMGFEICEEAWSSNRPGANLAQNGIDLILNPSASHFAFGKMKSRQGFVIEGSRAFNVGYIYSNLLGNESGRIIFDGGVLIASGGELLAQGERFSFKDASITTSVIDVEKNRVQRSRTTSLEPQLEQESDLCIESDFTVNESEITEIENSVQPWETSKQLKEEEFTRAISLGLFDFMRKSRQHGFVISLSGGIDSSAITALCRQSIDLAIQDIGIIEFKKKLNYISKIQKLDDVNEISKHLITCAYQATSNSSNETFEAAKAVASDASATFYNWNIDQVLENYINISEHALEEELTWDKHDITLQNVQARARGPGIWIIANVKNALLLATSNRSEAAVGYATMDGDTCGGISPIGGIDKNFLRQWFLWMSEVGPNKSRPYTSFKLVLSKPPTAELRPLSQNQTDENDLMPYEVLDEIERLAIRDKKSPLECFKILSKKNPNPKLKSWIVKFFKLWCRNQWKRERYAPAFHLDDESLDPKTWCRFPILMSGFEQEIQELENQ